MLVYCILQPDTFCGPLSWLILTDRPHHRTPHAHALAEQYSISFHALSPPALCLTFSLRDISVSSSANSTNNQPNQAANHHPLAPSTPNHSQTSHATPHTPLPATNERPPSTHEHIHFRQHHAQREQVGNKAVPSQARSE